MEPLKNLLASTKREFDTQKRILSFDEYLALMVQAPKKHLRSSAQYLVDMMDFFGKTPLKTPETEGNPAGQAPSRFHLFDLPVDGLADKLVGQEEVQEQLYRALQGFAQAGINTKLLLLHGPNGSAKTTLVHALMGGAERYSRETEGAQYTFSWVFPTDRQVKSGMGIQNYSAPADVATTYAHLADEEIAAKIHCELSDHPFLLVPAEQRKAFLESAIGREAAQALWAKLPHTITQGELCHRCREIADAILTSHHGDFGKVLRHIQVERILFSRRYRRGLVTIEPQLHVDAQFNQMTINKGFGALPTSLQNLNLFSVTGDLIEGNRGMIEFNDLLKRPIDSFKYLLTACERSSVGVGNTIAYLDTIFIGSCNEQQLDAFKEFPDFGSFKARMELIRVPYLLSVNEERQIYSTVLKKLTKHVAPHTDWTMALWTVLTRLKKPNPINYPPTVSALVSALSPLEKARLYSDHEFPGRLSPEDRKLLRSNARRIRDEYTTIPYYEGRLGASVREARSLLLDAAQNPEFPCVSPLAAFQEIDKFVKRVTEHEFLRQEIKDTYHDATEFIHVARNEYLDRIDREVRGSMGLYDSKQWDDFLKKYIHNISHLLKREKIQNSITGKHEDPDRALIAEFEKIVEAPKDGTELESFRQNMISQVGAWSLDHPQQAVVYSKVFPEYWAKLERHYFESQKHLLTKMHNALQVYGTDREDPYSEGTELAKKTIANMVQSHGYCEACAKEAISFLMKKRY